MNLKELFNVNLEEYYPAYVNTDLVKLKAPPVYDFEREFKLNAYTYINCSMILLSFKKVKKTK